MNKRISNILDCVEYCPLPIREVETQPAKKTERIVNLTMKKVYAERDTQFSQVPRRARMSFAYVAAVVVLAVAITGTALAATGVIDLGAFYNSIFRSEEAAPYVVGDGDISDGAEKEGISEVANLSELDISLVAAFVSGRTAYVEMEVSGESIPNTLFFFYHDEEIDYAGEMDYDLADGSQMLPTIPRVWSLTDTEPLVMRIDENTVRVALTLTQPYFTYFAFAKDDSQSIASIDSLTGLLVFDTVSSTSTLDNDSAVTYTGDWRFEFDIKAPDYISYTTNIGEYEAWFGYSATEVTVEVISRDGFENGFEYPFDSDGALVLTLFDGTTVTARFSSVDRQYNLPNQIILKYETEFVNPSNVESVAFCGEILRDAQRTGDGGA